MAEEQDSTLRLRQKQNAPLPTQAETKGTEVAADDPRERAARRAAELREHFSAGDDGSDKFRIDPSIIPPGWSYEWKTMTVLGQMNPSYEIGLAQRGWEAVPASRHPEMMPMHHTGATIDRDGLRLMERPAVITDDAKQRDRREARELVRGKEEQVKGMPAGPNSPFEPDNKGKNLNSLNKGYERMEIPKM